MFLQFKAVFLQKIKQLESNGQSQHVIDKINTWIDDNFDKLYKESNKVQFYKNNTGIIDQENKQKCQFMKYLKDNAEELVLKHKIIQRKKSVNQI